MRKNLFNLSVTWNHHQLLMNGLNDFCDCLDASLMKKIVQGFMNTTLNRIFNWHHRIVHQALLIGLDDICNIGKGLQFLMRKLSAQRGVKMIPWDLDKQFSSQFLYNFLWA